MKRFKAWLLQWLGGVSTQEWAHARDVDQQYFDQIESQHKVIVADLILELNSIRNTSSAVPPQRPAPRVIRSFRTFRDVVEGIPIERKSS